jgi:uncharacterized protein (DUF58 family)
MPSLRQFWQSIDREAWKRFFIALGGLGLAFGAAMFSTVFRRERAAIATAVSASIALLAAGFVAIYTVPYLAKRVALERVRDAFDYDVTKEGMVYLGIALVIGVAALNTGNNLLFIILAAMLAAILVSGMASAVVLRGLRLELSLPAQVFARQGVMARMRLSNRLPTPSFSINVGPPRARKHKSYEWRRGIFAFPPKRPPERQWVRVPDLQLRAVQAAPAADAIFRGSAYFPYIPARETLTADVELHFPRRGRYIQDGFGLSTRFPFSFLLKTRTVALASEVVVYPSVEPTDEFYQVLPLISGEFETFVRGRGYDLYRIREYMPEDSARHVDWKATAKSGGLKVREFTREDERKLRIIFDNAAPAAVSSAEYESAVELCASLAWHFAEADTELSFVAPGYSGSPDLADFLHYLALVEPAASESVLDHLPISVDDYNLIITARPQGSLPTELWASSYIIFMDSGRGDRE